MDPTALCLIEREVFELDEWEPVRGREEGATNWLKKLGLRFTIRGLELLPLGTRYQEIASHIAARYQHAAEHGTCKLIYDETGNRAGGDLLREKIPGAIGCHLTASEKDGRIDAKRFSVSKANMITGLLAAIDNQELIAAENLEEFPIFKAHLVDLRRKVSALGHLSFNASPGKHDDFATAVGLSWWYARH